MKTIKLPYKTSENLVTILKQYSSVIRYSYNRFLEGKTEKEVRYLIKSLNNINLLNSWLVQCAILDGKAIHKRFGNEKVIFGSKMNFINRLKNKITKEEYQLKRLLPVNIQGEVLKNGNRSFKLDIIDNNQIIFKLNRNKHIELKLPRLRKNIKNELFKLQQLNEVKTHQEGYTFSIRFDLNYIYISFEEFKKEENKNLNENRYLGIDLNPAAIGISILENDKVLYTREFSLKPIIDKILSENLNADSNKMKYFHNKLRFETIEISKSIAKLAKHYNCKFVFIEDLHFKDISEIKIVNRLVRNLWKKSLFISNLTKRLNIEGIKLYSVNPAYSTFIGNLQHDYTDAVNASIEIARRGYEIIIKKNKKGFFPNLVVKHHWKEMATTYTDWKKLFLDIKNLKLKYRVSLNDVKHSFKVFQQNSTRKSMVLNYIFYG